MSKNSGYIVKTKNGKIGRTFHSKGYVNGKTPVYLEKTEGKYDYSDSAILCEAKNLILKGHID